MIAIEPQQGARGLAPNAHRLELVGAPGALAWPALCPNCGAPARERIRVGKVFMVNYQFDDLPAWYRVCRVAIPFCAGCAARHRSEQPAASAAERLLTMVRAEMAIPMVLMGAAALFCAREAIASLPDQVGASVMGGLGLLFALGSAACARSAWKRSERFRVPPQTSVTLACDFSDDISDPFDEQRRVYAIRDPRFAETFGDMNAQAAWDPEAPRARRARSRRGVASALLIIAAVVGLILQHFTK
jgi:hypothetical protein